MIEDQDGDVVMRVCEACGSIISDFSLAPDDPTKLQQETKPSVTLGQLASKVKSHYSETEPVGKTEILNVIKTFTRQNNLSQDIEKSAQSLYLKVYKHQSVISRSLEKKRLFGIACVYVVMRQFGYPVILREFCLKNRLNVHAVAHAQKCVIDISEIKLPFQSIEVLVGNILTQKGFDKEIMSDTLQVINICEKTWISGGVSRDHIVHLSAYYAWGISKPSNMSVSYSEFCKRFKIMPSRKMYACIRKVLMQLVDKLPWSQCKGKANYITVNLNEALKYHRTLINSASVELDKKDAEEIKNAEATDSSIPSLLVNSSIKKENEYIADRNAFCPPIFNKRKREVEEHYEIRLVDWDGETLTEDQDKELDQYIRNPKEIKLIEEEMKM